MSKSYYVINCKDGLKRQAIDVMRKAMGREKFGCHCLATAFKYISRIGRKPDNPNQQELEKIKEYCGWAKENLDKEELEYYINQYIHITELGEELKKYCL